MLDGSAPRSLHCCPHVRITRVDVPFGRVHVRVASDYVQGVSVNVLRPARDAGVARPDRRRILGVEDLLKQYA